MQDLQLKELELEAFKTSRNLHDKDLLNRELLDKKTEPTAVFQGDEGKAGKRAGASRAEELRAAPELEDSVDAGIRSGPNAADGESFEGEDNGVGGRGPARTKQKPYHVEETDQTGHFVPKPPPKYQPVIVSGAE